MYKIGVFGGSFNPPHNGHVHLALQTKAELKLDKMLIMPTGISPHKDKAAVSFDERCEMCRLAFTEYDGFEICDIEGKTTSRNYTINSLRLIKKQYPQNSAFYLIIGADMLFYFENWYKYESILRECNVVAAARQNGQYVDMVEYATEIGKIKVLNLPVKQVSSSEVREKIHNGMDASDLLPSAVMDYIKKKRFYI